MKYTIESLTKSFQTITAEYEKYAYESLLLDLSYLGNNSSYSEFGKEVFNFINKVAAMKGFDIEEVDKMVNQLLALRKSISLETTSVLMKKEVVEAVSDILYLQLDTFAPNISTDLVLDKIMSYTKEEGNSEFYKEVMRAIDVKMTKQKFEQVLDEGLAAMPLKMKANVDRLFDNIDYASLKTNDEATKTFKNEIISEFILNNDFGSVPANLDKLSDIDEELDKKLDDISFLIDAVNYCLAIIFAKPFEQLEDLKEFKAFNEKILLLSDENGLKAADSEAFEEVFESIAPFHEERIERIISLSGKVEEIIGNVKGLPSDFISKAEILLKLYVLLNGEQYTSIPENLKEYASTSKNYEEVEKTEIITYIQPKLEALKAFLEEEFSTYGKMYKRMIMGRVLGEIPSVFKRTNDFFEFVKEHIDRMTSEKRMVVINFIDEKLSDPFDGDYDEFEDDLEVQKTDN
ncbi:MAG: hypothetical protein MJ113_07110 [Lachnospiraceae bacterium]|nr:hypothetical protein [Lachnospiraceae bacterium]